MKHSFWKRFLALVMAIAIVLSTGVLDSAGWLLANNGEETSQESTTTTPPSDQQGGSSTETLDLTTDPTGESTVSTDPTGESTEATDPTGESTESTDPTGESTEATDPSEGGETTEETTESTPVNEVTLTVVIQSVYADETQGLTVLGTEYLTYAEGEESKTIEVLIPEVEGYTFTITGAVMTKNEEGKHVATLARPTESGMLYITVTYSPIVTEGEEPTEGEGTETPVEGEEGETPVEGEETAEPTEGEEAAALTTTLIVSSWDMGGVLTFEDAVYSYTWAEDETEKTVSFPVASLDGYAYMVDSEDFAGDGAGNFSGTIARPETSNTIYVDVFYRAVESVEPDEVYDPEKTAVATYRFLVDGVEQTEFTQKIVTGDTVLLPATPYKDGYKFIGWNTDAKATTDNFAQPTTVTVTGEVVYNAIFAELHYVYFMSHEGVVIETKSGTKDEVITTSDVSYEPGSQLGVTDWSKTKPTYTNGVSSAVTGVGGSVTIESADITLYPIIEKGNWVYFKSEGGTYVAPAFVAPNGKTVMPNTTPTRSGYTFQGWFKSLQDTTAYTFGETITEDLTLYAKWKGGEASYLVIYWLENANDNEFSYAASEKIEGATAGDQTAAVAKTYENFTLIEVGNTKFPDKGFAQTEIAGDNSTIVNIYYARDVYEVKFYELTCTKTSSSHNHTQSCFDQATAKTISAKHGAYIGDKWPANINGGKEWYVGPNETTWQAGINTMPIGGMSFYSRKSSSSNTVTAYYYTEVLDSVTTGGTVVSGKRYVLHHSDTVYSGSGTTVTKEDRYDILGFTVNESVSTKNGRSYNNAKFYYTRNDYTVEFINNGNSLPTVTKQYQEPLDGLDLTAPARPDTIPSDYVFKGWYDNQAMAGDPFVATGKTMPANNITLYAKWGPVDYTGFIYLTIDGSDENPVKITIPYGGKISQEEVDKHKPTIPEGNKWYGWSTTPNVYTPYNFDRQIYSNISLYPYYSDNNGFSVIYDANGGTGSVTDGKVYATDAHADIQPATGLTAPAGMVFKEWNTAADGTGTSYLHGDKVKIEYSDVTLYAIWGPKPTTTSITYDANGGQGGTKTYSDLEANSAQVAKDIGELGFSRPGYTFLGWSRSDSATTATYKAGNKIIVGRDAASNVLFAVWEINKHNITYSYTGTLPEGIEDTLPAGQTDVPYGTTGIEVADTPEVPKGYEFTGWTSNVTVNEDGTFTMPDNDVSFVGNWKLLTTGYTVKYVWGEQETILVTLGTETGEKLIGSELNADAKTFEGYTLNKTLSAESQTITLNADASQNVITFYYQKEVTVTITGNNASVTYDGTEKEVTGYTEAIDPNDSGYTTGDFTFNATAVAKGTNVGTYNMGLKTEQFTNNNDLYKVTFEVVDGTLTISHNTAEITVTTTGGTFTYDGKVHGATVAVTGLPAGYTVATATSNATATDVTTAAVTAKCDTLVIKDSTGADVTASLTIKYVDGSITVNPATITIVTDSASKVYDGTALTAPGRVEGLVNNETVSFTVTGTQTNVGTSDNTYTLEWTGTAKESNYIIGIVSVGKLTITASSNWELRLDGYSGVYDAQTHAVTVTPSVTEGTIISYSIDSGETWTDTLPTITDVGEVDVRVKAENPNYNTLVEIATLKVTPATLTIVTPDANKVYDGTALTAEGSITGFVGGETATFATTGTQTEVGSSKNTYSLTWDGTAKASNYTISETIGTLVVTETESEIVVTTTGGTFTYDGQAHGATVSVSTLPAGYTLVTATSDASATHVAEGVVKATCDTLVIKNAAGEDVTSKLKITYIDGTIEITPATLTVTTESANKTYNGEALTAPGEIKGFVNNETATFTVTGSQTAVGSSENSYSLAWDGTAAATDYAISETLGTLTVKEYAEEITVTTTGGEFTYDGQAHGATVSVSTLPAGYTLVTATSDDSATHVAEGVVEATCDTLVIKNAAGEDVTSKLNIKYTDGTIKINPRPVTLTSGDADKVYDGTPLTNGTVTVGGMDFVDGEGATYNVTGTITNVGSTANAFTYTLNEGTDAANYSITKVEGTLTINPITDVVTVTITEHGDTRTYNGSEQSVSGYDVKISNNLYKEADFSFKGNDTVKGTEVGTYQMELKPADFVNNNPNFTNVVFEIVDGQLVINPLEVTVTIVGNNDTKVYNREEQSVTGYTISDDSTLYDETTYVEGPASDKSVAKRTDVGTTNMGLAAEQFSNTNANFDVTINVTDGWLEITPVTDKVTVTITERSGEFTYDGTTKRVEGYDVSIDNDLYTEEDFVYNGYAYDIFVRDVGVYDRSIEAEDFENLNKNFTNVEFVIVDGQVKVNPAKVTVTITGNTGTKVYNREEQSVTGYTITDDSELYDETTYVAGPASDKSVAKGTDVATYYMGLAKEQFSNTNANFDVTINVTDGWLEITPYTDEVTVTITGHNNTTDYDGAEHTVSGYDVEISNPLYKESDFTFSGTAKAARTDAGTTNMGLAEEQFANINTNFTNVTFVVTDGYQTINPIDVTVTITGHTNTTIYNSKEHTVSGYDVKISNDLYKETDFTFSGTAVASGTVVGEYPMGLAPEQFKNNNANFATVTFQVTDGYQKINPKAVTITAATDAKEYDGTPLTNAGFTAMGLAEDDVAASAVVTGSITNVGTVANIPSAAKIVDENGKDVTTSYTITYVAGALTITQSTKELKVVANTNTWAYDGTAHSDGGYTVTFGEEEYKIAAGESATLSTGDTVTATITKTVTDVADSAEGNNEIVTLVVENADQYKTITEVDGTLTITPIDVTVTIVGNNNTAVYDGEEHTVTDYVATADTELYDVTKDFTFSGEAVASRTEEGTTYMGLTPEQFANTNGNFATVTFQVTDGYQTITPIDEVVVTITGHNNTTDYDGAEHTVSGYDVEISNPLYKESDFTFSGEAVAKRTDAGTTNMGLAENQFANTNANFTKVTFVITDGYQTINPIDVTVTITEHSDSLVYDGAEHTVSGYDVEISNPLYTKLDYVFSGTASVSGTNVRTYDMELKPENFANINENFANVTFVIVDGKLEITKMDLTITADSASKEYDGNALTKDSYTATALAAGDKFESVTVTGTITEVGSTANVPSDAKILDENNNDVTGNYNITYVNGTLTITQSTKELKVVANSNTWEYDSEYHADGGYTVTYGDETHKVAAGESATLSTGDKVTATITKQVKNVADSGVNEIVTLVIEHQDQYANIKTENGTLTITPRPITITADDASKEYDGTALTKDSYTNSDPATGDEITSVTVTGSITAVGTTDNVPSDAVIMDGTEEVTANYDVEYVNGKLEITQSTKVLKVVANSNSWTYDSEYHADGGYTVTYGEEEYKIAAGESATLSTGDKVTATITKQVKNVADTAEGNNEIVELVIENAEQYANVETEAGTLEITPREITVTADSDAKEYDGTALTKDSYTNSDPAKGDEITSVTVTGSITEIGKVDNVPSDAVIMDGAEDVTANYDIEYVNGELEITASSKSLVVTANSNTWTYDSEYHADGGYTVSYNGQTITVAAGESATLSTGDKVTATITAQVKNVADTVEGNNVIVELVVENAEQYASIVKVAGTLEITPREITVTADSASKEYDGTALTKDSYTNSDPATNDEITSVTVTGSITKVGTTANVPSAAVIMDGEEDVTANYAITYVNGQLEITESTKVLKVVANSNSWEYDSEYHADGGYTVTYGDETHTVAAGESATLSTGDKVTATITKQVKNVADTAEGNNEIVTLVVENEAQYANIETVAGTLTITQKAVTITADSDAKEYDGTALTDDGYTIEGLATGDAETSVTVTGTITEVGSVDNVPSDAIIMDGTEDVTANYAITYVNGTLKITQTTKVLKVVANSNTWTYDSEYHADGGYTVTYGDEEYKVAAGESATLSTGDKVTATITKQVKNVADTAEGNNEIVTLVVENEEQYANIETVAGTLTITQKEVTITADSNAKEYDGTALTDDGYTIGGLATGDAETSVTVTGTITEIGKVDNVPSEAVIMDGAEDVTANYDIEYVNGELEITASTKSLVVTANSNTWTYDSEYHADGGYTVSYNGETITVAAGESATLSTGDKVTATITAQVKNVADTAEGNNVIVELVVENAEQYASIVKVNGTLEITPREITVTADSNAKEYDGTALTDDGYTYTAPAEGDKVASVTVTGSITEVGTTANVPSAAVIMDGEEDVTANYAITYVNGQLEITQSTKVLKVVANSNTWTYDSEYHADGGYTVTYGDETYTVAAGESATLSTGDKVTATITKQVKNVADSGVNEIVKLVVENEDQYATIETENGKLEITQKSVTITADSASREYNGTALTKDSYTSTDLAEGDSYASVTVTGTITEVGSVDNVPSDAIIMDGEEDVTANYAITYVNGKLTINAMSDEVVVTIRENSGSAMYDGKLHTVNGYEVIDISDELYTVSDFTFSGDATINGTDAGTYEMELESGDFANISDNFAKVTFVIEDGELEISKRTVTMTSADATKAYDGLPLTDKTVTVTGDGFVSGEGAAYDVTGSQTEFGSSANTFTYTLWQNTKADNYIITTVEGTLEVTASEDKVTVVIRENSDSFMYDGTEHTVTGYVVTSISDPLYTEADFTFSGDATVKGTDAGTYDMELKSTDFANISDNFANVEFIILDGQLEITKRNVTMTSATDTKVYDGTALTNDTVTVTGDGFVAGEGASYDVTGSRTEFGSSANTFTYTLNEGTKADNYIIKTVEGTLTVTALTDKVTVVITENSGEYTYDGQRHEVTGYVVTSISNPLYTVADFSFNGKDSVDGIDAGVYDMQLKPNNFANISKNFANVEFVIVDGQLTINKRALTLTSDSDSKEYDGIALTAQNVEVTEGSFVEGEGYTVNITGTQTLVGVSDNTFTYSLNQGTKAGNYEITVVYGKLTITDRENPYVVVVEANSGEQVYNGQPFTVSGLMSATVTRMAARIDGQTVTFLLNGETYTISGLHAERTETHVNPDGYEVAITGTPVITDSKGNDVTKQFTVETISGQLTITPAPVTMVSADDTKLYDGTELINHEVTVEGFMEGEGATFDVTGTQTLIGSSDNEFTYTLTEGTLAQDYTIETTFGTLTVTPPEDYEIVDKSHKAEGNYRLGDTVTFDITVENIFSEEAKAVITEQEGVSILWNGEKVQSVVTTIPAGESITIQAEYIIQEKDLLAGEFVNVVDVTLNATVDKIPYEGKDDDEDIVDKIEDPKAQLKLEKVTTSTPAAENGKYVVGETITYQITATNTGNLTLHDVVIYDVLTGESRSEYAVETAPIETSFKLDVELAPGESKTFTYSHTVVEEDLGKNLINAVTASAGNSSETDDEEKNDTPTDIIPDEVKDPTDDIRRGLDVEKTVLNKKDIYKLHTYVEYQITITNLGNVTERGAILTDIMDAQGLAKQFTFTDLDGGQLLPGNRVLLADIAPGETLTILCKYWVDGKDEDLPVNNKAIVESGDGDFTDEDDAETVKVEKLYNLTIYYLSDDWQVVMAPEYHGRYSVGHTYYVESPEIEGYEANYKTIWSGWDGMPEHDVVLYVLYSKLPEVTTEPTETTAPTEPSEETTEPTTAPTEPTYDLTEIPEDEVPLGDLDLGDHTCCIMHFLIMLVAMILLGFYTKDRKKYQERIHELKRSLAAEDAAEAVTGEEQA